MTTDKGREILRKRFNAEPNAYKVDERTNSLAYNSQGAQPSVQSLSEYSEWLEGQIIEMAMSCLFTEDS